MSAGSENTSAAAIESLLKGCESEPIQFIDSVQSHGWLLVTTGKDCSLHAWSQNVSIVEQLVQGDSDSWESWGSALFGENSAAITLLKNEALELPEPGQRSRTLQFSFSGKMVELSILKNSRQQLLWEIEPVPEERQVPFGSLVTMMSAVGLGTPDSFAGPTAGGGDYLQNFAQYTRALLGFDRLMIYKFHPDSHGEVIAEAADADMHKFLGLHYPASDIPAKARALYKSTIVRSVADIEATPQALVYRNDGSRGSVDLGNCALRSLSPIHIHYLRNMGVRASLSISLVVEGKLWGLIACHHRHPFQVDASLRDSAAILAGLLSAQLGSMESRAFTAELDERRVCLDALIEVIIKHDSLESLQQKEETLMKLVSADGVAVIAEGKLLFSCGEVPDEEILSGLNESLKGFKQQGVFYTDSLKKTTGASFANRDCAGMCALWFGDQNEHSIFWFRKELVKTISWAGNLEKSKVLRTESGQQRLMPRSSFESWSQTVKGYSTPWGASSLSAVREFRTLLVELWLNKVQRAHKETRRIKEELEVFMMAVSHDLRAPLISLLNTITVLEKDPDASIGQRKSEFERLKLWGKKVNKLTQDLIQFSKLGELSLHISDFAPDEVIKDVLGYVTARYAKEDVVIELQEPMCAIRADIRRFEQIIANLVGNAIKHNRDVESLRVAIRQSVDEKGAVKFSVEDNGKGMPDYYSNRAFELFEQLNSEIEGSGVGLAVVKKLVEMHGGRVGFFANSQGDKEPRGCTFFFELP